MADDRSNTVQKLLQLSRRTLLERVDILERAAVELLVAGVVEPEALDEAVGTAHQLISLGTFGVLRGSLLAGRAEALLQSDPLPPDAGAVLAELALGIRDAIETAVGPVDEAAPPRVSRPGTRVLLVEDDELMVLLLTRALVESGCEVAHVGNGLAALEVLSSEDLPQLVLLDIDLPGLDGFSVLRSLRERGVLARTRVVVLSARASEHDILGALELGATDHVSKPFSLPVLLARVKQLTGGT